MAIRIGTSGWSYDHWQPELYPDGLPSRDRLARYAAAFSTAELNSSFYRWPRPLVWVWAGGSVIRSVMERVRSSAVRLNSLWMAM